MRIHPAHQTLIVFGSRYWYDRDMIVTDLKDAYDYGYRLLVHGDCPTGADALANEIWREWGCAIEAHPADWKQYGRRAGPIRNLHMARLGAGAAIGYRLPGKSDGTDGMRRECHEAQIPTLLRGEGWP